jgi:hypothetical protein
MTAKTEAENAILQKKIDKIRALKRIILTNNLETCHDFYHYNDLELAELYNGIGSASWFKWFRNFVTFYYGFFEAAALIHDIGGLEKDKSKFNFRQWNNRFFRNCCKLIKRIPWILRGRKWLQANRLFYALKWFGWKAWICETIYRGEK